MIGYRMLYIGYFDLWSMKAMLIWYDMIGIKHQNQRVYWCPLLFTSFHVAEIHWSSRLPGSVRDCGHCLDDLTPPTRDLVSAATRRRSFTSNRGRQSLASHWFTLSNHTISSWGFHGEIMWNLVLMWEVSIQDQNFIACQFTASSLPNIGNELMNTGVNEVKRCRSRHTINKHQSTYNIKSILVYPSVITVSFVEISWDFRLNKWLLSLTGSSPSPSSWHPRATRLLAAVAIVNTLVRLRDTVSSSSLEAEKKTTSREHSQIFPKMT